MKFYLYSHYERYIYLYVIVYISASSVHIHHEWNTLPTRLTTYILLQNNTQLIICLVHLIWAND